MLKAISGVAAASRHSSRAGHQQAAQSVGHKSDGAEISQADSSHSGTAIGACRCCHPAYEFSRRRHECNCGCEVVSAMRTACYVWCKGFKEGRV